MMVPTDCCFFFAVLFAVSVSVFSAVADDGAKYVLRLLPLMLLLLLLLH